MTTATATPFVSTPFGGAVVEIDSGNKLYVRLRSGWRFWIRAEKCERIERPDWYREPETSLIAGWVR